VSVKNARDGAENQVFALKILRKADGMHAPSRADPRHG
jgi:hypothetical protein